MEARSIGRVFFLSIHEALHSSIFDRMPFLQLDSTDAQACDELLRVMRSDFPVAMLQLPAVFALIAPPTEAGVQALNKAKNRIVGKYYGSAIGELSAFVSMALQQHVPDDFRNDLQSMRVMEGAFIRLKVTNGMDDTACVTNGTHQGLLLSEGPERKLFRAIEEAFALNAPNALFTGGSYYAPICTSANVSGDPLGSIVDMERALRFADERNISLVISNSAEKSYESGSYPIFSFDRNTVSVMRRGPRQERILRALPTTIVVR